MERPVPESAGQQTPSVFSSLSADAQVQVLTECRGLTEAIYPGLDLSTEIRAAADHGLGETVLLMESEQIRGFAVCHCGPDTEAGAGHCYLKFAAVAPGDGDAARFRCLLDRCEALAAQRGLETMTAGVSTARQEVYGLMLDRRYRAVHQGVAMHRPNAPAYDRPGVYVLDDWR